jgi:hypothetical protein
MKIPVPNPPAWGADPVGPPVGLLVGVVGGSVVGPDVARDVGIVVGSVLGGVEAVRVGGAGRVTVADAEAETVRVCHGCLGGW